MANRWWVYQRERFPVLAHGLLIAENYYKPRLGLRKQLRPRGNYRFLLPYAETKSFWQARMSGHVLAASSEWV